MHPASFNKKEGEREGGELSHARPIPIEIPPRERGLRLPNSQNYNQSPLVVQLPLPPAHTPQHTHTQFRIHAQLSCFTFPATDSVKEKSLEREREGGGGNQSFGKIIQRQCRRRNKKKWQTNPPRCCSRASNSPKRYTTLALIPSTTSLPCPYEQQCIQMSTPSMLSPPPAKPRKKRN